MRRNEQLSVLASIAFCATLLIAGAVSLSFVVRLAAWAGLDYVVRNLTLLESLLSFVALPMLVIASAFGVGALVFIATKKWHGVQMSISSIVTALIVYIVLQVFDASLVFPDYSGKYLGDAGVAALEFGFKALLYIVPIALVVLIVAGVLLARSYREHKHVRTQVKKLLVAIPVTVLIIIIINVFIGLPTQEKKLQEQKSLPVPMEQGTSTLEE